MFIHFQKMQTVFSENKSTIKDTVTRKIFRSFIRKEKKKNSLLEFIHTFVAWKLLFLLKENAFSSDEISLLDCVDMNYENISLFILYTKNKYFIQSPSCME